MKQAFSVSPRKQPSEMGHPRHTPGENGLRTMRCGERVWGIPKAILSDTMDRVSGGLCFMGKMRLLALTTFLLCSAGLPAHADTTLAGPDFNSTLPPQFDAAKTAGL